MSFPRAHRGEERSREGVVPRLVGAGPAEEHLLSRPGSRRRRDARLAEQLLLRCAEPEPRGQVGLRT
jgi:hypothetical protein